VIPVAISAALTVYWIRIEIVIGRTPAGAGVWALVTGASGLTVTRALRLAQIDYDASLQGPGIANVMPTGMDD
jgi:hypothetical protein